MEAESVTLLPRVCAVLASGSALPDDTSLEKLLDWFSELSAAGVSLVKDCPCLLELTSTVVDGTSSDPCILSFVLKMAGLLSASEEGFAVLQESFVLSRVFDAHRWKEAGHWEDPCVRIGWIQGLRSMLQHSKALEFFVQAGLIEPLLHLQTDTSLFVASAASQTLAHILIFYQPSPYLRSHCSQKNGAAVSPDPSSTSYEHPPVPMETNQTFTTVVSSIADHLKTSLGTREKDLLPKIQQSLKVLVLLLTQLRPPLRDSLLHTFIDPLEGLVTADHGQLTPPLIDAILAAHSCGSDERVNCLVSSLLSTRKPSDLLQFAAAFLRRGPNDTVHTPQCVRVLLFPLHIVTGQLLQCTNPADEHLSSMAVQLQTKSSCIYIVCTCLTNIPLITLRDPSGLPCPLDRIVSSVLLLLRLCRGDARSLSAACSETVRNVIGSSKVKKCALEALMSISNSPGAEAQVVGVFTLLLEYLHDPDSDPTVLHKSYQVLTKWLSVSKDLSSIPDQLKQDLFNSVRKRVCDLRWEVRDSTVEFLGQLSAVTVSHAPNAEAQGASEGLMNGCGSIIPLLKEALLDPESYVRASAICALARAQTHSWQEGAALTQEQAEFVARLLDVLSEDTEGFARRAVVQYFIAWFSACSSRPALLRESVRSVLSQGSADLDWEVKVHTLELAELLLDDAFSGRSGHKRNLDTQCIHPYAVTEEPVYTLHTHTQGAKDEDDAVAALVEPLVEQGVVSVLLSGLVDCDRPVALKACQLLIALREAVCPASHTHLNTATAVDVSCVLPKSGWAVEIRKLLRGETQPEEGSTQRNPDLMDGLKSGEGFSSVQAEEGGRARNGSVSERVNVCKLLRNLGLDERVNILNQSSDHVQNSPLSLLQDILTAKGAHSQPDTQPLQEVIVDCY